MRIYAIADLHLSFNTNIDKPMDIFGSGWENHTARVRAAWEEMISDDDIVLIPGDISWALKLDDAMDDLAWIHSMPGTKLLSKGNHDLWWNRIRYLNSLYDDIVFLQNDCYVIEQENIVVTATRGWPYPGSDEYTEHDEKIYAREIQRLKLGLKAAETKAPGARIIVCLHFPPSDPSGRETGFTSVLEEFGVWKCVYGHLHGKPAHAKGIKGTVRGVEYILAALDYLGSVPRLIYDSGE